jgi:hypothetical protein
MSNVLFILLLHDVTHAASNTVRPALSEQLARVHLWLEHADLRTPHGVVNWEIQARHKRTNIGCFQRGMETKASVSKEGR